MLLLKSCVSVSVLNSSDIFGPVGAAILFFDLVLFMA